MICPYDGVQCLDNCRCPCPAMRQATRRAVMPRVWVVAALALGVVAMIWAMRAHGAEMRFEQSVPTIGSARVDPGLWPPDDTPRAQFAAAAEIMAIFRSRVTVAGEYDRQGRMRGFRVLCDF
jgi:hypothetical protein